MKKSFLNQSKFVVACLAGTMAFSSAYATKTPVVAKLNGLADAIAATSDGDTLLLKSGEIYLNNLELTVEKKITIMGDNKAVVNGVYAATTPAIIQRDAIAGDYNVNLIIANTDIVIKDVVLQGCTTFGESINSTLYAGNDSINVTLEGVVVYNSKIALKIADYSWGYNVVFKNNIFWNLCSQNNGMQGSGYLVSWMPWHSSLILENNTIFNYGRSICLQDGQKCSKEVIIHNTFVNGWGTPLAGISSDSVYVQNNLFINSMLQGLQGYGPGHDKLRDWKDWWNYNIDVVNWSSTGCGVDSFAGIVAICPSQADSIVSGKGKRVVKVNNNLQYYYPDAIAHMGNGVGNQIFTQPLINDEMYLFGKRYGWDISGNLLWDKGLWKKDAGAEYGDQSKYGFNGAVDPGLIIDPVSYVPYANASLNMNVDNTKEVTNTLYKSVGYDHQTVEWPLPEAVTFKVTNPALLTAGTDGKPLGDLKWYAGGVSVKETSKLDLALKLIPSISNGSDVTVSFDTNKLSKANITITNLAGVVVAQQSADAKSISVSSLSNGMYLIQVVGSEGASLPVKLIVSK